MHKLTHSVCMDFYKVDSNSKILMDTKEQHNARSIITMSLVKLILRPRRSMGQLQGQVHVLQKELLLTCKALLKAEEDILTVVDFVAELRDEQTQHLEFTRNCSTMCHYLFEPMEVI